VACIFHAFKDQLAIHPHGYAPSKHKHTETTLVVVRESPSCVPAPLCEPNPNNGLHCKSRRGPTPAPNGTRSGPPYPLRSDLWPTEQQLLRGQNPSALRGPEHRKRRLIENRANDCTSEIRKKELGASIATMNEHVPFLQSLASASQSLLQDHKSFCTQYPLFLRVQCLYN
jgi:hypothetical protein